MQKILTSNKLIDGLVRSCFGVEPGTMAALAQGDVQARLRQAPGAVQVLDGVEVFLRRTVATGLAIRGGTGPVRLHTEAQARARGWPCARLADMATVLAWALVLSDGPSASVPVLLEAAEASDDLGASFGDGDLPALDDLLDRFYEPDPIDGDAPGMAEGACSETPSRGCHHVRLGALVADWFGIDVLATELPSDRDAPPLVSADARAIVVLVEVITGGLALGAAMRGEVIEAARVKTEADARVAGEPGALVANAVLLMACAVWHGAGWTPHLLAPREHAAADLAEAGRRIRSECREAGGCIEARMVALFDMRDHVARQHIHVGRLAMQRVAQRLLRDDA